MNARTIRTFIIPNFCANAPRKDINKAIIPQQKPLTKPATILLYLGKVFWAKTRVTGCASIVVKPISAKIVIDKIGIVLYVLAKAIIIGKVAHIEK